MSTPTISNQFSYNLEGKHPTKAKKTVVEIQRFKGKSTLKVEVLSSRVDDTTYKVQYLWNTTPNLGWIPNQENLTTLLEEFVKPEKQISGIRIKPNTFTKIITDSNLKDLSKKKIKLPLFKGTDLETVMAGGVAKEDGYRMGYAWTPNANKKGALQIPVLASLIHQADRALRPNNKNVLEHFCCTIEGKPAYFGDKPLVNHKEDIVVNLVPGSGTRAVPLTMHAHYLKFTNKCVLQFHLNTDKYSDTEGVRKLILASVKELLKGEPQDVSKQENPVIGDLHDMPVKDVKKKKVKKKLPLDKNNATDLSLTKKILYAFAAITALYLTYKGIRHGYQKANNWYVKPALSK